MPREGCAIKIELPNALLGERARDFRVPPVISTKPPSKLTKLTNRFAHILTVLPFIPFCIGLAAEPHVVVESNGYAVRTRHAQDVIYDFSDGLRPAKRARQKKTALIANLIRVSSFLCFHSLIFRGRFTVAE